MVTDGRKIASGLWEQAVEKWEVDKESKRGNACTLKELGTATEV